MGLGEFTTRSNATYLRIGMGVDDKDRPRAVIAKRCKEGTPGAVQVFKASGDPALDKDGNTVWRMEYPNVEGMVAKIVRSVQEYNGKDIHTLDIHIEDGGSLFILQIDRGDEYWGDFAMRCPNIKWDKPVKLCPYSIPREDNPEKRNRILMVYQGDEKVQRAWNKESTDGPPQPVFDEDEKKWMWGKRNNWLDNGPIEEAIKLVSYTDRTTVPGEGANFDDIV
jgi:hypothetical protein